MKNIVICLDGTGSQLGEHNTNVVKLYRTLKRDTVTQVVYYDPGVGTLGDPDYKTPIGKQLTRLLGLAFGRGIIRNIEEAYSFLMEHYQQDDRIYIFGFSRGAYTARALAAFIHNFGLLDSGCQNLIPYAMKLFRTRVVNWEILTKDQQKYGKRFPFHLLLNLIPYIRRLCESRSPQWSTIGRFKKTYGTACDIHFLGLWDSVKTFGWVYNPIFLPNTTNNKSVQIVRHAIAIDERRSFFQKMLWKKSPHQDMKQVWFPGVHGDVGGGYPEPDSGLAKVALQWMIEEAKEAGLQIITQEYVCSVLGENSGKYIKPNPLAELHNSLVGPWWLIQFLPRLMWDPDKGKRGGKVLKFPDREREIPHESVLHISVLERLQSGEYQPKNLGLSTYEPTKVQAALLENQYSFEPPLLGES